MATNGTTESNLLVEVNNKNSSVKREPSQPAIDKVAVTGSTVVTDPSSSLSVKKPIERSPSESKSPGKAQATTNGDGDMARTRVGSASNESGANRISPPRTPFLIGVAGGTASGKSTVCSKIMEKLGQDTMDRYHQRVVCISQDSFYRELKVRVTFL